MKLTEASSEMEASMICGFLESHGIRATYDKGDIVQPLDWANAAAGSGRQEILVGAKDAERAAELLAHLPR